MLQSNSKPSLTISKKTPQNAEAFANAMVSYAYTNEVGDKRYELSNHLGNVLSVVSDKKIPTFTNSSLNL